MPVPITTPRINNNDDVVRFSHILCPPGTAVKKGDPIAEIETDKATFTVETDEEGYLLAFVPHVGEEIQVGSVLAWLGRSPDEAIPMPGDGAGGTAPHAEPTLKAAILLAQFGLTAEEVPRNGERLTAQDVMTFVQRRHLQPSAHAASSQPPGVNPELAPGERIPLTVSQRAMLKSVLWHRQTAVPGYVEIEYDTRPWDDYANRFQREHNLLLSPLLPLMAYRLVTLAAENAHLNCTILGDERHEYRTVNLGFTLQSETRLSLLSIRDAAKLNEVEFVRQLHSLMRRGMKEKLTLEDTTDVTISFSSMSRWEVTRHIPVLPPYTALIVAHAYAKDHVATLGATYDHRVLTGGHVAGVLRSVIVPFTAETETTRHLYPAGE